MNISKKYKPVRGTAPNSIAQRLTHHVRRLNKTRVVQNTYTYLNQNMFFARVASIGYSVWEWTKRKTAKDEEEEEKRHNRITKEEFEEEFPQYGIQEKLINDNRDIDKRMKDPIKASKKIEKLLEEERKKALIEEQREACILELAAKSF